MKNSTTILERVELALKSLGGVGKLKDIYKAYEKISKKNEISKTYTSSVQARIEENSIETDSFKGKDLFGPLYGKGKGIWYLKSFFTGIEEAKFIFEIKEKRIELWEKIKTKKIHKNIFIKENKIHLGERGIYRDIKNTRTENLPDGLTVSLLDTGKVYDDVLSNTHLLYFYPNTKNQTTDKGEINSLKNAEKFHVPIFIVLGINNDTSSKEIRLGYIKSQNHEQKLCLVEFQNNNNLIINSEIEDKIFEEDDDNDDDDLFNSSSKKKRSISTNRSNNQPKFRADVFRYYENKCAVCEIKLFLDAAHIIPVAYNGKDVKKNGIILCKNHHTAFDKNLFKINSENLNIEISSSSFEDLRITQKNIKHLKNKPGEKYLSWRYKSYKS